ncbi:hypothetical protein QBC46DRAFT_260698 [Diplogelasinospora grovesii]|uniref:Uncharacterized protein n=1 Tax=Diplogelasinospora grovesii TaxID=303347 RepID=A0AAN6N821_9PEZI|nr:hypothetical protein QBC46DRAFT_260698 [Diplogelasinospora grovesii]
MLSHPHLSESRRHDAQDTCQGPRKSGHCPEILLKDDHYHLPPPPAAATFEMPNTFFNHYGEGPEHEETWQLPRKQAACPASSQTSSRAELERLSSRPYSTRVLDASDFASAWESAVIPVLSELLQKSCASDFAVDVHNLAEMSSQDVPRVVYVTISDAVDSEFEQNIKDELARSVPSRFGPLYVRFRKGHVKKSGWWGKEEGGKDSVCLPRNSGFRKDPSPGMSIGPVCVPDAASLGGFVRVGTELYAMSAFHAFEDSFKHGNLKVRHPAIPDVPIANLQDSSAQYGIGALTMWAHKGAMRPSLTFRDTGIPEQLTRVEMDWCLIGPVANGKNVISVPPFDMDRHVAVQETAAAEGNTEVYALARTSGYSLDFTSDVPGLQRIGGTLRREWTVRQYLPVQHPSETRAEPPLQTLKQWVTSGIGVPGDSGAWLIRRRDNALMGLVWARNHDCGSPLERVRLTYFTPIVDILADARERHTEEEVSLPHYSASEISLDMPLRGQRLLIDASAEEPWPGFQRDGIQQRRQARLEFIRACLANVTVPTDAPFSFVNVRSQIDVELGDEPMRGHAGAASSVQVFDELRTEGSQLEPPEPRAVSPTEDLSLSTFDSRGRILLGINMGCSAQTVDSKAAPDSRTPELSTCSSTTSSCAGSSLGESSHATHPMSNDIRVVSDDGIYEDAIADVEEPIRAKASWPFACHELVRLVQPCP